MSKNAIVTLAIGARFQEGFKTWFLPGWKSYCARHDLDLIVIDTPLDDSPRAKSRSPAWQKCLIHRHPDVARRPRVAWVDADIRIRPDSPNVFDQAAPEEIGAVNEFAAPSQEDYAMAIDKLYRQWDATGTKYVNNRTPREYHGQFGLEAPPGRPYDGVVQTGMILFSPKLHGDVFQKTYDTYEDKGDASWTYEMRPLSHEIFMSGALRWISVKFNMGWPLYEMVFYPFLGAAPGRLRGLVERLSGNGRMKLRRKCVLAAFENNYFLHFAGGSRDYMLLPAGQALEGPI